MQLNPGGPAAGGWVIFAVPEEARPFQRKLRAAMTNPGPAPVRVLVTGMGARNAERAFLAALADGTVAPKWILTCGFAGGLNPELRSGAVGFDADSAFPLAERLQRAGLTAWKFECATTVATTVAEKSALRRATQADAVEMESGVLRRLARERGIPSATVRVISDAADEPLPLDFNTLMTPEMNLSLPRLLVRLAGSPGKIPQLIRFGRQTQRAAGGLAEILMLVLA